MPMVPPERHTRQITREGDTVQGVYFPRFTHLDFVQAAEGRTIFRHQHRNYELILVVDGTYRCSINETPLTLPAFSALAVRPGDWHEDYVTPGVSYFALRLTMESVSPAEAAPRLFRPGGNPQHLWFKGRYRDFQADLDAIRRESEFGDPFSPSLQDMLAGRIFWNVLRRLPAEVFAPAFLDQSQRNRFSRELRSLFEQRKFQPFGVEEMAEKMGMSLRMFHERCLEVLGLPPAKAYLVSRLERARLLLRQTDLAIKTISEYTGFTDPYHFSKAYRRYYDKSPSKDRAG